MRLRRNQVIIKMEDHIIVDILMIEEIEIQVIREIIGVEIEILKKEDQDMMIIDIIEEVSLDQRSQSMIRREVMKKNRNLDQDHMINLINMKNALIRKEDLILMKNQERNHNNKELIKKIIKIDKISKIEEREAKIDMINIKAEDMKQLIKHIRNMMINKNMMINRNMMIDKDMKIKVQLINNKIQINNLVKMIKRLIIFPNRVIRDLSRMILKKNMFQLSRD